MTASADRRSGGVHVLLDLDGTISDSALGIGRSLRHAFTSCGYEPPSDAAVRSVIGPPFEVSFPSLGVAHDDIARVIDAYRVRYEDVGLFENEMYPGIVEMLDELEAAGHTVSLATAKPEPTAVRIVEHFGLSDRFRVMAGASPTVGNGPRTKAEVITYALAELGLTRPRTAGRTGNGLRTDVVMVGDRDHDVEGALHNGLPCIGVTWGFGSFDELRSAGAADIVDDRSEVGAAVLGLATG